MRDGETRDEMAPLDLEKLARYPIPERIHRVGEIMPIGTTGLITAHGGMGKTQLAIDLCLAVADGGAFLGMNTLPAVAALVSEEDDARDFHYRLVHQCTHRNVDMAVLANRVFVYPTNETSGQPLVVRGRDGFVEATSRYMALRAELIKRDVMFLVLDNLAAMCAVNINDPGEATQALSMLGQLVPIEGNVALIAHVDKASAKAGYGSQGYSGTAAWHNRARWRWYLFSPNKADDADDTDELDTNDDGRRILEVQKVNGGRWGQRYALRIGANGVIGLDGVDDSIVGTIRRGNERRYVLAAIHEARELGINVPVSETNRSTAYEALEAMPSYPADMRGKAGKRRLFRVLRQLRADREIQTCEFIGSGRHRREGYEHARIAA